MVRQGDLTKHSPFHDFICVNCGRPMGVHWIFQPEKLADVFTLTRQGRKPDGKYYCHRDQCGFASSYYQRSLRRIMADGYSHSRV